MSGQFSWRNKSSSVILLDNINFEGQYGVNDEYDDLKIAIILVGLPGYGKTFIARKIEGYLNWIDLPTKSYNVGAYRQQKLGVKYLDAEYFNPDMIEKQDFLLRSLIDMVETMVKDIDDKETKIGIVDSTNTTDKERTAIEDLLPYDIYRMYIEVECSESVRDQSIGRKIVLHESVTHDKHFDEQYKKKVKYILDSREPFESQSSSYIKFFRSTDKLDYEINLISGHIQTKISSFLINLNIGSRTIYLSCPGESQYCNTVLGGNCSLTPLGHQYATNLVKYFEDLKIFSSGQFLILTSTFLRSKETASHFVDVPIKHWKALDDMNRGKFDSKSIEDVTKDNPGWHKDRETDRFNYRYPGGESYRDLISRLEPVILEIERMDIPLLIISHHSILQCLMAYFKGLKKYDVPNMKVEYHRLIRIEINEFSTTTDIIDIGPGTSSVYDH